MSLLCTLTAVFLYAEIVMILLLVLPIGKAKKWAHLFELRLFWSLKKLSKGVFMCLGFVFMYDALKTWNLSNLGAETKMFAKTQCNLYISGWALILSVVIHRLINYIETEARLTAKSAEVKQKKIASNPVDKNIQGDKKDWKN